MSQVQNDYFRIQEKIKRNDQAFTPRVPSLERTESQGSKEFSRTASQGFFT